MAAQQGGPPQAQLAEQVQLLLNRVHHLNGQADQQAQKLQEMADYGQIKNELIN